MSKARRTWELIRALVLYLWRRDHATAYLLASWATSLPELERRHASTLVKHLAWSFGIEE